MECCAGGFHPSPRQTTKERDDARAVDQCEQGSEIEEWKMIPKYIEQFKQADTEIRSAFSASHPDGYKEILTEVVKHLEGLDHKRVHEIDDGNYQGTLVYVIGETGYQPSEYVTARVSYGSCSACDTFESIRNYTDDAPSQKQVNNYMTLALHMVESMWPIDGSIA